MSRSLRTRLILSFVVVIIISMGTFALVGRVSINQWFNEMVLKTGKQYAQRMSVLFALYYGEKGSWDGVENLLVSFQGIQIQNPIGIPLLAPAKNNVLITETFPPALPQGILELRDERLLLFDHDGNIVFDSHPGEEITDRLLNYRESGVKIIVNGEEVGTVVAASGIGIFNELQKAFLINVNRLVLFGGLIAMVLAIALGTLLAINIVKPVKALSEASKKLANGDYSQRIPITSTDELGEMSTSFNQMASDLQNQETLRRRALADVAHELRTPLSVLQIDLESIEDGLIDPDLETIQRLQSEVEILKNLVEDLRTLSLADAGELLLTFQPLEINGLIRVNARRIENAAKEREIEVKLTLAEDDLAVSGDEQRLSQVLLNLFSNAVQFTPRHGSIQIKTEKAGEKILISIQDTGEGIAPEDLPHIFERLYRSDRARARKNGGSGLGLSIARSLVTAHNGKIWAESVLGLGSTFFIELPILISK